MKTQYKITTNRKKKLATAIILAIVLLAVGVVAYEQHQKTEAITKERAQYAQAEKNLEGLSDRIVMKFGQPDDLEKVKSCGYTSSEAFGREGTLFCNIGQRLTYTVKDINDAKSYVQGDETLEISDEQVISGEPPVDIAYTKFDVESLNCFISYTFDYANDLADKNYILRIELECSSKNPKDIYFPLKNS